MLVLNACNHEFVRGKLSMLWKESEKFFNRYERKGNVLVAIGYS
jgi:hypothetical protein